MSVAVALLLVFGYPLFWLGDLIAARRSLQDVLSELEAAGYAPPLSEFAVPAIPDDSNAALHFERVRTTLSYPTRQETDAVDALLDRGHGGLSESDRRTLRAALDRNADAWDLLARARACPDCLLPFDPDQPLKDRTAELVWIRRAAFWGGAVRMRFELGEGRIAEAREALLDGFALAGALRHEPSVVSQLVRMSCLNMMLLHAESSIAPDWPAEDLRRWLEALPPVSDLEHMTDRSVAYELSHTVRQVRESPAYFEPYVDFGLAEDARATAWERMLRRPLVIRDTGELLRRWRGMLDAQRGDGPAAWRRSESECALWDARMREESPVCSSQGRCHLAPIRQQTEVQARLAVLREGLAWEITRAETGAYPPSPVGRDPYTGSPLICDAAKSRVYSVGPNGKDDGGNPYGYREATGTVEGDFIWELGPRGK